MQTPNLSSIDTIIGHVRGPDFAFVATVAEVYLDGISLIIPPSTVPSEERYPRLITGGSIAAEDTVLCAKTGNTFVVLGKIALS